MDTKNRKLADQEVPTRYQSRRAHIERDYQDEMEDEIEKALRGQYLLPSEPANQPSILRVKTMETERQPVEARPMPGQPRPGVQSKAKPAMPGRPPFHKGNKYGHKPVRTAA